MLVLLLILGHSVIRLPFREGYNFTKAYSLKVTTQFQEQFCFCIVQWANASLYLYIVYHSAGAYGEKNGSMHMNTCHVLNIVKHDYKP